MDNLDNTPDQAVIKKKLKKITYYRNKIVEAQEGLKGIGYALADGVNTKNPEERLGFAIAGLADYIEYLADGIDEAVTDIESNPALGLMVGADPVTGASPPNHIN